MVCATPASFAPISILPIAIPKVSIVVPCYNATATVAATLKSALAQSFHDYEIVVVDDGSTDATAQILMDFAARYPAVRVIRRRNGGLAEARNTGIAASRGQLIALLDADDCLDPDYLGRHVANITARSLDISFSRVRYIDQTGQATGAVTNPQLDGLQAQDFLISNPCTAFLVIRRQLFDTAGAFDPSLRRVEDQEWLFRAVSSGARIGGIAATLASYRITSGSLSSDTTAMRHAFETMLDRARCIAPELVALHATTARARMLRYCARRVLDHGQDSELALAFMREALLLKPSLLLTEPKSTIATALASLIPSLAPRFFGTRRRTLAGAR